MTLWTPSKGIVLRDTNVGSVGAATVYGTAVATGASPAKGSAVQLIGTTAFEAFRVIIMASGYGASGQNCGGCLDIMIGGAGVEVVLIPDLLMGYCGTTGAARKGPKFWEFPLYVPAGSRISARASGERAAFAPVTVGVKLVGGRGVPEGSFGTKVTTYGVASGIAATAVTPGTSAVEGAWTEIALATSERHIALVPSVQLQTNTAVAIANYSVDLGIGTSGNEVEVGGPYLYDTDTNEVMGGSYFSDPCWADIPAGTRLVMRASCGGTPDTGFQGAIHAVS